MEPKARSIPWSAQYSSRNIKKRILLPGRKKVFLFPSWRGGEKPKPSSTCQKRHSKGVWSINARPPKGPSGRTKRRRTRLLVERWAGRGGAAWLIFPQGSFWGPGGDNGLHLRDLIPDQNHHSCYSYSCCTPYEPTVDDTPKMRIVCI